MWQFVDKEGCQSQDSFHLSKKLIPPERYYSILQSYSPQHLTTWEIAIKLIKDTGICCCPRSIPLVMITAYCISSKLTSDFFYSNEFLARIGGISLKLLNTLELIFMQKLGWITKNSSIRSDSSN